MSYGAKGKNHPDLPIPKRSPSPSGPAHTYGDATAQYASFPSAATSSSQPYSSTSDSNHWFSSPPPSAPGMAHAYAAQLSTPGPSTARLYAEAPDSADQFQFSTTLRKGERGYFSPSC